MDANVVPSITTKFNKVTFRAGAPKPDASHALDSQARELTALSIPASPLIGPASRESPEDQWH